jgi:transcriptional regulator GlxA family with amidase domain
MMQRSPGRPPLTVITLVYPGVRLLDVTGPAEVFASANDFGARYRLRTMSLDGRDVETSAGTRLGVDFGISEAVEAAEGCAVALIPGGPQWEQLVKDDELLDAVRTLDSVSQCTASVCTGAFLLAAAGLLDGGRATTHWRHTAELASRHPRVHVTPDALYVRDGRVMTSAGVSAGIDMSLALVEEHHGADVARQVAKDMVVFMQRPGGQSQFSIRSQAGPTRHEAMRRLLDAVAAEPGADHTLAGLARRSGMSARHLTRLFRDELGTTPARYVERVRLEAAQGMLERGDDTMASIARRTGFGSPESMRRAFMRHLGTTPGVFRARFRTTGAANEGKGVTLPG